MGALQYASRLWQNLSSLKFSPQSSGVSRLAQRQRKIATKRTKVIDSELSHLKSLVSKSKKFLGKLELTFKEHDENYKTTLSS